jgi:site-specific DNA-methyltransferase (adenine-specific)
MKKTPSNEVLVGDCREVMKTLPENYISACITDPPYNYEFIGHKWDDSEIQRRIERVNGKGNKTLVKNIPYGSGLAGGVRNEKW